MLTTKQEKEYFLNDCHYCPKCESDNISSKHGVVVTSDNGIATDEIECKDCKTTWKDVYQLVRIEN